MRLVLLALALLLLTAAATSAQPGAKPTCVTHGKKWSQYDAHGGASPKLTATGTTYSIALMGVSCAYAKAALAKMFPTMRRPPYGTMLTLTGGPTGFKCRSQVGNRPDVGFGGQCANLATHKLFQWAPYNPNA